MSLTNVCPWWNTPVRIKTANRARCPHCGRRVKVSDWKIEYHEKPGYGA